MNRIIRPAGTAAVALAAALSAGVVVPADGQVRARSGRGHVTVNGARLYYEEAGSGPAVVLVHGGSIDRRMWDREFAWLARDFRVVRYDVRGHGLSEAGSVPFADFEDLGALLDSLGIRRAAIIGLSLGGRIVADFAIARPDRVWALVLVGPGLSGFPFHGPEFEAYRSEMRQAAEVGGLRAVNEIFVRWWCVGPNRARSEVDSAVVAAVETMAAGSGARWEIAPLGRELEPPAFRRLREIRAPTLAVVGSADMPNILEIVDSVSAQVPGAARVLIPGAAHMVNMERPAEFQAAVLPFLRRFAR